MKINKIRALWAVISTSIILVVIIIFMYIFRPINRTIRKSSKVFFWINGISVEKIGEFDKSAQILILNHQGIIDICYFEAYYPWDICWIAKKELGDIFLYGHLLKAPRMIFVDRENKKSLIHLLRESKKKLDEGRILAIFPEGTRSKGGRDLLPFKDGAKMLIEKYKLKIQPMVVINTRKLFDASTIEINANKARVVCLDSYTPDFNNPNWYKELRDKMEQVYQEHYDMMNGDKH